MSLLEKTKRSIEAQDSDCRAQAKAHLDQLAMPHWALGGLMDTALDLAGMTRSLTPAVVRRAVVIMAGDHGVVAEGVSLYPQAVTPQMVFNFVNGGAGINALARVSGARVIVVDMGVASDLGDLAERGQIIDRRIAAGTKNMAQGPAMTRDEAVRSIEAGIEIALELAETIDIFGAGEMGIGNTTASSAIAATLTGCPPGHVTGRGTGIDDQRLELKIRTIEKAIAVNEPDPADGVDVLAKVGGFEIGGMAGLILGAASQQKPVLIDGFISTAAALIAHAIEPNTADYMLAAHAGVEVGHRPILERLGKKPLLDLSLRLGEGTGAALAMCLVEGAARILTDVATFEEAAVSGAKT